MFSELEKANKKIARLEEIIAIFKCWFRLRQKSWPSECNSKEVGGCLLVLLDTEVAGCASAFLCNETLTQAQREVLYRCRDVLPSVVSELDGFPYWWFNQRKKLTSLILDYDDRWGIPDRQSSTST